MADTFFEDRKTLIVADWLNDVNRLTYDIRQTGVGKGAEMVAFKQAWMGAIDRTASDKLRESASVKDFGAIGDGATDDTAAFHAAFNSGVLAIYIPAGTYRVTSASGNLAMRSGLTVYGDGKGASVIKYETPDVAPTSSQMLFGTPPGSPDIENVTLRDFAIEGSWVDNAYSQRTYYPILMRKVTNLTISKIRVKFSTVMSIVARGCNNVLIEGCDVEYGARDGINTEECSNIRINGNSIRFVGDDAIANHNNILVGVDRYFSCTNNTIFMCIGGISAHQVREATITGNVIAFTTQKGIDVTGNPYTDPTGAVAPASITITGNTISNVLMRDSVDNQAQGGRYVYVGGYSANAGALPVLPGLNDPATGTVYDPYPYLNSGINTVGGTQAGSYNVIVSNNVFARTVSANGELLSSYGLGVFWTPWGASPGLVDATLNQNAMGNYGVYLDGDISENTIIDGNVFSGLRSGFVFTGANHKKVRVSRNVFSDLSNYPIHRIGTGAQHIDLEISDNLIDQDPYCKSTNRAADGSFSANSNPTAIFLGGAGNTTGIKVLRNTFRNTCRISDVSVTPDSAVTGGNMIFDGNILECEPAALGFSTSNKGIGVIPSGGRGFLHRIVGSDPTSANFGKLLNNCLIGASAMPTAGVYVQGHRVNNTSTTILGTAGSRYTVSGWLRLTTGSGHVSGTDWIEQRTLTGT